MFTDKEIAYIKSQPLARLATVAQDLQPDASPVGFDFDGDAGTARVKRIFFAYFDFYIIANLVIDFGDNLVQMVNDV